MLSMSVCLSVWQSGVQATRQLRQGRFGRSIIGVTGNSLEEELEDFAAAGASLVFTKPLVSLTLDKLLGFFLCHGFEDCRLQWDGHAFSRIRDQDQI